MNKSQILKMTGLSEEEFYKQYPTEDHFIKQHGGQLPQHKFGSFLKTIGNGVKDFGLYQADTILGSVGATDVIKDDMYTNQTFNKFGKIITPFAQQAVQMAASAYGGPMAGMAVGQVQGMAGGIDGTDPGLKQNAPVTSVNTVMKDGGLIQYNGPSHEQGGIPVDGQGNPVARNEATAEVEGGETSMDGYVFSDTLKDKNTGKTFAELSKSIQARYKGREDDIAKQSMNREMTRVMKANEEMRMKRENTMMKRKMGGFLKKYAPGGFIGMTGQEWGQFGIANAGNIIGLAQGLKPIEKAPVALNPYAATIAAGPTRLDPTEALASNTGTYTGTKRDIGSMVNGSGAGYLAGRLGASTQKYNADAQVHSTFANANAGLQEQWKGRMFQLGEQDRNSQWRSDDANRQSRAQKFNMVSQSAGALGQNFDSQMNRNMYKTLMDQYRLNQGQTPIGTSTTQDGSGNDVSVRPGFTGPVQGMQMPATVPTTSQDLSQYQSAPQYDYNQLEFMKQFRNRLMSPQDPGLKYGGKIMKRKGGNC